jgi:hypothetical protein
MAVLLAVCIAVCIAVAHVVGPTAVHQDELQAKIHAADVLYMHCSKFPTKRELLVNSLLHLDAELTRAENAGGSHDERWVP